jgi:hypothetical protein
VFLRGQLVTSRQAEADLRQQLGAALSSVASLTAALEREQQRRMP